LIPSELLSLTEAEWEARDALVEARRATERSAEASRLRRYRRGLLLAQGCSQRALDVGVNSLDRGTKSSLALAEFDGADRAIAILSGSVGTGKTVSAVDWLLRGVGASPFFITAPQFETRGRYDDEKNAAWRGATAMVLDDLGAEYADKNDHYLSELDALFDWYSSGKCRLVVTTNVAPEQFEDRYEQRIWSRLNESAHWYNVAGPDRRISNG
jgi:DNA replication protein DnaC